MKKIFPNIDSIATGNRIRQCMQMRGLSVKDVQEYMGFPAPQSVYHWLKGRRIPNNDHLYALSELFEVPIDVILCGNRKYQPPFNKKFSQQLHLSLSSKLIKHEKSDKQ